MKTTCISKRNHFIFIFTLLITAAVLIWNDEVKEGVINGISICMNTVVPSLFPMLIISAFFASVGMPDRIKRILFYPIKKVMHLSGQCAEVFYLGGTAGYPVGVKTAVSMYNSGKLDLSEAQKTALINVNPGIAFSLFVAGKQLCGTLIIGITLYFSVTISNLLLSYFLRGKEKTQKNDNKNYSETSISNAFINAVEGSVKSIVSICAWITVFTAFLALLIKLPAHKIILLFVEVTNAVKRSAAQQKYAICAFEMGFGGFCIFFQLLPDLIRLQIRPWKYLACRTFSGLSAYVLEFFFIKTIPGIILTNASCNTVFKPSSTSVYGSAALVFLCIVFMLSLTDPVRPVKKI